MTWRENVKRTLNVNVRYFPLALTFVEFVLGRFLFIGRIYLSLFALDFLFLVTVTDQ